MPDVLLIQPPVRDFYLTRQRTIPYGLASIAGALLDAGFSTEILDALATPRARELPWPPEMAPLAAHYGRADRSPFALFHRYQHFGAAFERLGEAARESAASLVGISSLFSAYGAEALATAEAVRRAHPGCRIVLGGHHPSAFPAEVLRSCAAVDFVVVGEGEPALPQLVRALRGEGELESVPGLVWRSSGDALRRNAPAVAALEHAPLPASGLLRARSQRGRAVIVASRGCPLRCSYCSLGAGAALPYRRRPVDSVLAELGRELDEREVSFVDFEDESLSSDRGWFLDLLAGVQRVAAGRPLELRAMNGLLPHTLDDEVVEAMRAAGFRSLNLSLGSSSAEQLRAFRRPDERAGFERALAAAERFGLSAVGYLIAGAPGQRAEGSVDDLLYLAARRVLVGLSIYYPAPGSEDFERCRDLGLLPGSPSLWRSSTLPLDSPTTSREQAATLLRLARLLNFAKALADRGEPLPLPAALAQVRLDDPPETAGRRLLAAFLHDGELRGLAPDGEVYVHRAAAALCRRFLDGLPGVRGTGQVPRPKRDLARSRGP
jgi:anaerobic magnesium-protoporphyrin IX monomethyl ester cyclase